MNKKINRKNSLIKWIFNIIFFGFLGLLIFTGIYKIANFEKIENETQQLESIGLSIEIPKDSYNIKHKKFEKFLYSIYLIEFMTEKSSQEVVDTIGDSLTKDGFQKIDEVGYISAYVRGDHHVVISMIKKERLYNITIYLDDWKHRLGM